MIGALIATLIGLILAGIVHIVTVLSVPQLAAESTQERLAVYAQADGFGILRPASDAPLEGLDPAMRYAVCPFDLSGSPFRFVANPPVDYWAISFHLSSGAAFYAVNNRSVGGAGIEILLARAADVARLRRAFPESQDRLVVVAPSTTGFALIRALVSAPSHVQLAEAGLEASECGAFQIPAGAQRDRGNSSSGDQALPRPVPAD